METKKLLIVEDNSDYADLIGARLGQQKDPAFHIEIAPRLDVAIQKLAQCDFDVILLDLNLPDSHGMETLVKIKPLGAKIPILVLTGMDDEALAIEAVRKGAQDYLIKGEADGKMLSRVIRYAMERNRMEEELRSMALVDSLTGLLNRRGFMMLSEQHAKLALRTKKGFLIFVADLDHLKRINDQFGHPQGDQALIYASEILKETFRKSDILARIGGDEFAMLAIDANLEGSKPLLLRLDNRLKEYHGTSKLLTAPLSLSIGVTCFDPEKPASIEDLLAEADKRMYESKYKKKVAR
ncbi:MAG: diguanylate cyclase [Candidatus Omnitrophica bacterium]|nr:diguanylate cyclase [Candidatus Omnitrophota bacterium]